MSNIRPEYYTLDELLAKRLFRIPHYQRAYSWGEKERKAMFDDIEKLKEKGFDNEDNVHFMSTVVGLRRKPRTIVTDQYFEIEVVDGQQRLTTLMILLKAIEQKLDSSVPDENQLAQELREFLVKRDDASLILLQTNHDSSQYFANFLRHGTCPAVSEGRTVADRELLRAISECKEFVDCWDDRIELLRILKNRLTFIFHEIDEEAAVYTVFEVLNNRGLHVSWLDRLKSMLMSVAFEDNQGNSGEHINELHQIWGRIYEFIGLHQGLSKESLTFGATLKSPSPISKPLGEEDAVKLLIGKANDKAAGAIKISNWLLLVTETANHVLNNMGPSREAVTKISQARLLAVAIRLGDLTDDEKKMLLDQWERTSFRIFGLCRKDARTCVGDYVRLARDISMTTHLRAENISNQIAKISDGKDHDIESALRNLKDSNCYEGWQDELRYLLYRYEEHLAEQQAQKFRNEQWNRIWRVSAAQSIEHILPQSRGSQEPLENQEGVFVHRLGNLLLLSPGLNSALRDREPITKVNDYRKTGLLIAAEIAHTIERSGWGIEQIERREQQLLNWIRTDFRIEPVVSPNEGHNPQRQNASTNTSPKREKYRKYFQGLIDELRETYNFTRASIGQPQNWYTFTYGVQGIYYCASFTRDSRVEASLRIKHEIGNLFGALKDQSAHIHANFGRELEWDLSDTTKRSIISVYRDGDIESSDSELEEIKEWHIENLLKLKEVFTPEIERALETIDNAEL